MYQQSVGRKQWHQSERERERQRRRRAGGVGEGRQRNPEGSLGTNGRRFIKVILLLPPTPDSWCAPHTPYGHAILHFWSLALTLRRKRQKTTSPPSPAALTPRYETNKTFACNDFPFPSELLWFSSSAAAQSSGGAEPQPWGVINHSCGNTPHPDSYGVSQWFIDPQPKSPSGTEYFNIALDMKCWKKTKQNKKTHSF